MTIEKCKDFVKDGYGTWDDTSKPTTFANMYDFMKNQNNIVMNLASGIWQPSTAYTVGAIIRSPNLPAGCVATCTVPGTSGTTEPKWTAYGTTVSDGACKWKVNKVNTDSQDTMVSEITKAINALHDTIKSEIKTAMLALFPVGTILETTNSANPSTYIGGTWELLPAGLTTISAGTYTETHNVNGTNVTDTYVFTAGSSEFTVNGTKTQGEAKHQITEGESASLNYQVATTTAGWLATGAVPQSVYNKTSASTSVSGTFTDRRYGKSYTDGTITYVNSSFIHTNAGNKPHNTIQPSYGIYRFRRTK